MENEELKPNPENSKSIQESIAPMVKNEKPRGKSPVLKFIALGILFVIGLALIVGAYFMGINKSSKQMTKSPTPTLTQTATDPTADWQTYAHSEYNYSFKHPAEWSVYSFKDYPYPDDPGVGDPNTLVVTTLSRYPRYSVGSGDGDIYIGFEISKLDPNLEQYINSLKKSEVVEDLTINGNIAYKVSQSDGDIIWIIKNKTGRKNIAISVLSYSAKSSDIATIERILSTFKFTDSASSVTLSPAPTDEMASWKKYSDINYPFNLSYPSGWKLRTTYGKSVNNTNNYRVAGVDISSNLTSGSTVIVNVIDPKGMSFYDWMKSYSGFGLEISTKPDSSYNGIPAYKHTYKNENGRADGVEIYYPLKDKIIFLGWNIYGYDQETADKIMSSLKFN